ncbi:hypothetical protein CYD30_28595 [Kosakonia cowanii]|nr:hypothetical protein CYD30_28595 [Kosakonia cowanii]
MIQTKVFRVADIMSLMKIQNIKIRQHLMDITLNMKYWNSNDYLMRACSMHEYCQSEMRITDSTFQMTDEIFISGEALLNK